MPETKESFEDMQLSEELNDFFVKNHALFEHWSGSEVFQALIRN